MYYYFYNGITVILKQQRGIYAWETYGLVAKFDLYQQNNHHVVWNQSFNNGLNW